jgi:hypothetical protein
MKIYFLIILSLISSSAMFSQNDKEKRTSYKLEIAANETQQYVMDVPESAYFVKEKILQIFCNETVFVECEVQGDSISKMKVVEKNLNPEKTIIIEFKQDAENRKEIRTDLHIINPFDKQLIYEAGMFTPMSEKWKSTSVLPIRPKLQNFEMWPHAIITLVLDNWHFK